MDRSRPTTSTGAFTDVREHLIALAQEAAKYEGLFTLTRAGHVLWFGTGYFARGEVVVKLSENDIRELPIEEGVVLFLGK